MARPRSARAGCPWAAGRKRRRQEHRRERSHGRLDTETRKAARAIRNECGARSSEAGSGSENSPGLKPRRYS